jgi:hypothetical protein
MTQGSGKGTGPPDWDTAEWREALARDFRTLVAKLEACNKAVAQAEREQDDIRLDEATTALQHLITFIHNGYPPAKDIHLVRVLSSLYMAIQTRRRGGNPGLFDRPIPDERPEGSNQPAPRKPTNTPSDDVQGHLAAAHELLRLGGHGAEKGAKKVAALCRKHDVKTITGQWITFGQISDGREDIRRGRASAAATENYENVLKDYDAVNDPRIDKYRYAARAAEVIVQNLASLAAREAPDRRRRVEK